MDNINLWKIGCRKQPNWKYLETPACGFKCVQICLLLSFIIIAVYGHLETVIKGEKDVRATISSTVAISIAMILFTILLRIACWTLLFSHGLEIGILAVMIFANFFMNLKMYRHSSYDFMTVVIIPWTAAAFQARRIFRSYKEMQEIVIMPPNPAGRMPNGHVVRG